MKFSRETSKIKLQRSDKLQTSNFKRAWYLVFNSPLVFGFWCLNFASEGGLV